MGKTFRSYTNCCGIQVLIFLFLVSIRGSAINVPAAEDLHSPSLPSVPEVNLRGSGIPESDLRHRFHSIISIHGSAKRTAMIHFDEKGFSARVFNGRRFFELNEIEELRITEWKGVPVKDETYIFYPETYDLILKSGERVTVQGNLTMFNTLSVSSGGNYANLFTFFYDYYRGGVWLNRGGKEYDIKTGSPVKGCVTGFQLIR